MRICKIKDGKPVATNIRSLRSDNKGVSFPNEPAESTLNKFGYYIINETDKPAYDATTQRLNRALELSSGVVTETWSVVDLDASVIASKVIKAAINRRKQVETGGTGWTDSRGKRYWLATDLNSQQKTVGQLAMITHGINSGVQHWKLDALTEVTEELEGEVETYEVRTTEFRPTTPNEFKEIATAIKNHIEKCFAAEGIVTQMAGLGVYTDFDTEFAKL